MNNTFTAYFDNIKMLSLASSALESCFITKSSCNSYWNHHWLGQTGQTAVLHALTLGHMRSNDYSTTKIFVVNFLLSTLSIMSTNCCSPRWITQVVGYSAVVPPVPVWNCLDSTIVIQDKPKTSFGKWIHVLAYYCNFVNFEHKTFWTVFSSQFWIAALSIQKIKLKKTGCITLTWEEVCNINH